MKTKQFKNTKRNKFIIKNLKSGLFIYELINGRYVRSNCN